MSGINSVESTKGLALVTGAAKRVGREISLHLARKGYALALHYHTSEYEAFQLTDELTSSGVSAYPIKADLRDPAQIEDMFRYVQGIPYRLRLLVNSAALMEKTNLLTIDVETWDRIHAVNTRAVWLCSRESAALMHEGGLILNLSDIGAGKTWTGYGAYVISKGAVEALTRLLARQLAPRVRVCGIAPGLLLKDGSQSIEDWQKLNDRTPLKRQASKNELCELIDFLLANEYITGEVISLGGGYQLV